MSPPPDNVRVTVRDRTKGSVFGVRLTAKLWQGRDGTARRIYVNRADGSTVGWYDLTTGRHQLHAPELERQFWATAFAKRDRLADAEGQGDVAAAPRSQTRPTPSAPPSAPSVSPQEPAVADLAENRPGQAAAAAAAEARRAHPILTVLARLVGVRGRARLFAIGAAGERRVGRQLERLAAAEGWRVLHAVPVGRGSADIDHVLIGAFGVVVVNTKRTRGRVWVGQNGLIVGKTRTDYLQKSRGEARRVGRLLEQQLGYTVPTTPAIVFVGAQSVTARLGGARDVAVCTSTRQLRHWIRRRTGAELDSGAVEAVYAAARRPDTWQH